MKLSQPQRDLLEARAAAYEKNLSEAREYLEGRGFSGEVARSSRLGLVVDPLPGDERNVGRLSIPYLTRAGVVGIRFRCTHTDHSIHPGCPKYLGDAGAPTHLYGVDSLFEPGDFIVVTEGELDALTLKQLGIPAVGCPGATNWKPHYSRIFEDFATVYVFADGDAAGRKFGDRVAEATEGVVVVEMPLGMDVGSVYTDMDDGAEWLRSKVGR